MSEFAEFTIEPAGRIKRLPPYLFARINAMKHAMRQAGDDVIDLAMGNPIDRPKQEVIDKLCEAVQDTRNHRYSVSVGVYNLRREVARLYERRWGVELDPASEVIACLGSKEGFSHMCLAMMGPGDTAIVGDPAFPIHIYAVALAGGNVITVPLGNDDKFLRRIEDTLEHLYPKPKLLILNYPHNPSAITVEQSFFDEVVRIASKHQVAVIHDFAYGLTCFDDYKAPSFLASPGAKNVGVEFITMSKGYNMAGWRMGFCLGNKQMIKALSTIKGYYDYGIFQPVQIASIIALRQGDDKIIEQAKIYEARRDVIVAGLRRLGWEVESPRGTMFVWAKVPDDQLAGQGTIEFSLQLLEGAKVAVSPGRAFGENGEKYVRVALVENEQRLRQAVRQIEVFLGKRPGKRTRPTRETAQ
jgi:alanine-synthesizing transaminase